jgi:hypothetical protein
MRLDDDYAWGGMTQHAGRVVATHFDHFPMPVGEVGLISCSCTICCSCTIWQIVIPACLNSELGKVCDGCSAVCYEAYDFKAVVACRAKGL